MDSRSSKGKYTLSIDEFKKHWVSITSDTEDKGIAMYFEPTERFLNFSTEAEFKNALFGSCLAIC